MDIVLAHASSNSLDGIGDMDGSGYQYFHAGEKGKQKQWDSNIFDFTKTEVLRFLLSNVRFWLEEFRFDGFRLDAVTSMLYHHHGMHDFSGDYNDYFNDATDLDSLTMLRLISKISRIVDINAILIAEDVSGFPGLCRSIEDGGFGMDYRLAMNIPDYVSF